MRILPVLFLLLFLASCSYENEATAPTVVPEPTDDAVLDADDALLLDLVNEVRTRGCTCGNQTMPAVSTLTWNQRLDTAAARHATDMHRNDEMSHTGSDGSNAGDRISRAGYTWRAYAENVAWGYRSVDAVFEGWLTSAGHCRNIMNPDVREMGFARSGDYWAQVFAAARD